MSRDFNIAVDVVAPPERVWAVMSDVEKWPEWTASVKRIHKLDKGPLQIGSRAIVRQPKLPPALWKVTELKPDYSFAWKSTGPGFSVIGTHSVEGRAAGSHVSLSLRFEGLFGGLAGRLTSGLNRHYLQLEAAGLKRRVEQS
jgi:uncharacterized membrane protein